MVETPGRLSLWAVEVFVAVVEEGSVSAAAKRLSASVSSVSQQLTNLEKALACTLINRSTRPQQLTSAGALFLRRARNILAETTQAKAELAVFNLSQMTRLRMGMIEDFDAEVMPRLMMQLAGALKGCRFLLESGASYSLVNMLEARALDAVVVADHDIAKSWMEVHTLLREPFVAVVPKGRAEAGGTSLEALSGLPFIRYSSRQMMGRQIEAHLTRQRIELPNRFEFASYHAILSLVASGHGWTITTPLGFMAAQRFHDAVEMVPVPFKAFSRSISLIARAGEMENIPHDIAGLMRPLIRDHLVTPCVARFPWLADRLRVIHPETEGA